MVVLAIPESSEAENVDSTETLVTDEEECDSVGEETE